MNNPILLSIAAFGLVCSAIAIYYILRLRASFAGLPRLERPWLLLGLGVASLFVAAVTIPLDELVPSFGYSHPVQILAAVLAAFFVLAAMVTMKQAWTIAEGD
jgi:hypothetical protein